MQNTRWGLTLPLEGAGIGDLPALAEELYGLGYTDFWSSEVDVTDGLTPLAAVAGRGVPAHLGTAILPVFTRGPAVLAQSAATMAGLAPGRFSLGIGASSPAVVRDWNAVAHDAPFARVRDTLHFLREALSGARVDHAYETFSVRGFQLKYVPETQPPLVVAALRPGMLRLAAAEADGTAINWLSAEDVGRVREVVGPDLPVVARILVCPTTDAEQARAFGRRLIAAYLNVPAYAEFQRWLGRGDVLRGMWDCWSTGDRRGALAAVPDEVVDQLIVHGSPAQCANHLERYATHGVSVPVSFLLPIGADLREAARRLAPLSEGQERAPDWD